MNLLKESKLTPDVNVQPKTSAAAQESNAQSEEETANTSKATNGSSNPTNSNRNDDTIPIETISKAADDNGKTDAEMDAIRRRRLQHYQPATSSN